MLVDGPTCAVAVCLAGVLPFSPVYQKTVFDAVNIADATSEDMLDAIGEALSFLHLCPPVFKTDKTPIEKLKGYKRSDIFQTKHTYRLTVVAEQMSFLKHGNKKAMVG